MDSDLARRTVPVLVALLRAVGLERTAWLVDAGEYMARRSPLSPSGSRPTSPVRRVPPLDS
jgi:hypothetical protein